MSRHTVTVQQPVERLEFVQCDMCGETTKHSENWSNNLRGFYRRDYLELEYHRLDGYPEGAIGFRVRVDLCSRCFVKKLAPWLIEQGVKLFQTDADYPYEVKGPWVPSLDPADEPVKED